jgi:hypothetical protein
MATNETETAGSATSTADPRVGRSITGIAARTTEYSSPLWVLAVGTLCLDTSLTVYGLELGLTELNPVAVDLFAAVGVVPALVGLKAGALGVGVLGWRVLPPDYRGVAPAGLALPWTVACLANLLAIGIVLLS